MTHDLAALAEVVGYLVAITVLAHACASEGLFEAWGGAVARAGARSPRRLVLLAALLATGVTVTLTLDATVVLLTPVLLAAGLAATGAMLTLRLANSASLLLPVSNLTNLLAFTAADLTFGRFTLLMLPVWVVAVAGELLVVRWWARRRGEEPRARVGEPVPVPVFATVVVLAVLLGLATGVTPWIPATLGALVLGLHALARRRTRALDVVRAANLPLALVVILWGWLVIAVAATPVGDRVADVVPHGHGWWAVVLTALVAMVAANLVNNLPATLLLLPVAAAVGPVSVLAVLVGVNVGANLTAIGSLANILWRRSAREVVGWGSVHRLGLATTPLLVVACSTVLWAWSQVLPATR